MSESWLNKLTSLFRRHPLPDVSEWFTVRWDDEGVHVKDFKEPWANKHPDPTANSYWYDLSYNGALIERFILVSVDGARAELPLPDRNTLEAEPLIYKVAEIFDELNTLEEYMKRSGLSVRST